MIKSMTGFGRCEIMEHDRKFTVELKSVNHRYLDVNIKMPISFYFFVNFAKMLTLKCVVIPMRRKTAANRRISPFYSRFYSKHDLFCRQISLCL